MLKNKLKNKSIKEKKVSMKVYNDPIKCQNV